MRNFLMAGPGVMALVLSGCAQVPDDTRGGVGFGDYGQYSQERSARQTALAGGASNQTILPPAGDAGATDIAALAGEALNEVESQPSAATPARPGSTSISDEQDFDAVAERESIESDAERLRRMQEQRVEVAPTAVPTRTGSSGPNIIEYALATTHPVGEQRHRRSPLGQGRHERNCLSYRSDDLAQEAFLSMGGPERDRQALDPDGDGYACNWNPGVYRNAAAAARGQ